MSAFDFVFGLLSVIASLALTHLVSGTVQMLRTGARPTLFLSIWMWIAFATTVGNWGGSWTMQASQAFPAALVLILLALMIGQYVLCALVVPASDQGREADIGTSRQEERPYYVGAFCALLVLAIAVNLGLPVSLGEPIPIVPIALSVMQIGLALVALRGPWPWSRLCASLVIAGLATYWMVIACQIVGGS